MNAPSRLVSLWDMMKLPIRMLVGSFMKITDFGRVMHDASIDRRGKSCTLPPSDYEDLLTDIENFCVACDEIGLIVTLKSSRDLQEMVKGLRCPDGSGVIAANDVPLFGNYAALIAGCLPREADTKVAITIPSGMVKYFEPKEHLFGVAVNDQFPDAAEDIEDAGRCLALGQGTAAVMHLMRVAEIGLKALATSLKIRYAPSWESYLFQIQKKIAEKHSSKSVKWKRDEKFYRDVSGDLMTIKQAWRNPTMHVGRKYFPDEAEVILGAVRTLMQTLATKLASVKKTGGKPLV